MPLTEDFGFKIIVVGDSSVGKSCLLRRFQGEPFDDGYPATFGVDYVMRRIEIDDDIIKLVIWDTAGQERFRALTKSYYQNADAVIVAFDITCLTSFQNVSSWVAEARRWGSEEIKILLVACKCDLFRARVIPRSDGQRVASDLGVMYLETSAKEMTNVNETFISLAAQLKHLAETRDQRLFERNRRHKETTLKIRRHLYSAIDDEKEAVVKGNGDTSLRRKRTGACGSSSSSQNSKCA